MCVLYQSCEQSNLGFVKFNACLPLYIVCNCYLLPWHIVCLGEVGVSLMLLHFCSECLLFFRQFLWIYWGWGYIGHLHTYIQICDIFTSSSLSSLYCHPLPLSLSLLFFLSLYVCLSLSPSLSVSVSVSLSLTLSLSLFLMKTENDALF